MGNNSNRTNDNRITSLIINSITWARDSHGLFDYEWNKVVKTNNIIHGCAFVHRIGDSWYISEPAEYDPIENASVLATIVFMKNKYWIYHSKTPPTQDVEKNSTSIAWLIVK